MPDLRCHLCSCPCLSGSAQSLPNSVSLVCLGWPLSGPSNCRPPPPGRICRGLLPVSPHLQWSLSSWLSLRATRACVSGGRRAVALDEGGREGTTCCWATVPWIPQPPPRSVSKATWGDVVTAVGRCFLARGGAGMGSGSVNSVSPHSQVPWPQDICLEARKERQPIQATKVPRSVCSHGGALFLPRTVSPTKSTPALCPPCPCACPAFSLLYINIHLLVFKPFSHNFGWKMSVR